MLFSCQKEYTLDIPPLTNTNNQGTTTVNFTGNWKFVNFSASTLAINEMDDAGVKTKTITTSNYTSENNAGTVVFTNQSMNYSNVAYSVNATAIGTIYEDGVFIDSITFPVQLTVPPTTAQVAFTRVGADSLSYPAGTVTIGGTPSNGPAGSRVRIEGDKLFMTQRFYDSTNSVVQGMKIKEVKTANVVTVFQKL